MKNITTTTISRLSALINKPNAHVVLGLALLALLTVFLGACGTAQSATTTSKSDKAESTAEATATVESTVEATATVESTAEATVTVEATAAADGGAPIKLKVGVSPVPHGEILNFLKEKLAPAAGLDLEVIEFTDYVQPNLALQDGQLDANYFQHVPYLQDFSKEHKIDLVPVVKVHIEPLGIYSGKIKSLSEVPDKAVVAIPNDATNGGRALNLLAANGLLKLKEGAGTAATVNDIVDNPKHLDIKELEAAQLPRSLEDTTLSVINGNYALDSGLTPSKDALALESGENNPYANILAVLKGHEKDPGILKLAELLNSPEVKKFIEDKYQGSVLPAFGKIESTAEATATVESTVEATATVESTAEATATVEATVEATVTVEATAAADGGAPIKLKVGVSPVPHGEILNFLKEKLAPAAGLDLEVIEFTDYVQPNLALQDGQLDANYFQHVPYLQDFSKEHKIDLVPVVKVHIEPLGIYSGKIKSLSEVPDKAVVAIPNDATNGGRALNLLAANGLLKLKEGAGTAATVNDIVDNPKHLDIKELEAAQLPRSLEDTTLSVINGNYALDSGLTPSKDALALESGENNPYANILAVLKGHEKDPGILKLAELLNSPEVKKFIEDKYQGSVLPAF